MSQSAYVLHCAAPFSPIASSPKEICTPSNIWFLGPTRLTTPNGISIESAVFFSEFTFVTNGQTDRRTDGRTDRTHTSLSLYVAIND